MQIMLISVFDLAKVFTRIQRSSHFEFKESMFRLRIVNLVLCLSRNSLKSSTLLLCLHDMMGNISVDISGFQMTNQTVQQWQKPTFIRTAERMLHVTHHTMPHIMHIHIS